MKWDLLEADKPWAMDTREQFAKAIEAVPLMTVVNAASGSYNANAKFNAAALMQAVCAEACRSAPLNLALGKAQTVARQSKQDGAVEPTT